MPADARAEAQGARTWRPAVNIVGSATIIAVLVVWQATDAAGLLTFQYIPPPSGIAAALTDVVRTGELWPPLTHTVTAVLAAWTIATVAGLVLGVTVGLVPPAWRWTMASVEVLRTLPAVALVPVALLVFGYSVSTEIIVAAYVALWPVVVSSALALQSTHPRLIDIARTFRLSRRQRFQKLLLPAAWPQIVVAARLALALSLVLVVLTEMVGNPAGLGYALVREQQALQPERMWAYLMVIGMLGVALQAGLNALSRRAFPGLAPQLITVAR